MTFSPKSLRRLDAQTAVGSTAGTINQAQVSKYFYVTDDAPAVVEVAGYFNAARDAGRLTKGCTIEASMTNSGTPVAKIYVVTAAPASGNVTIALAATAAG